MLTELQVKSAKPKDKRYMMRDDKGLYLRVDPSGNKYWILRYWEQKKEHQISLGPYPDLSLKDARIKRDEIQTARAKGETPLSTMGRYPQIFADVVAEWLKVRMADRAESYVRTVRLRLNKYILPEIGATPLMKITSADVLKICRDIESLGHNETARRVKTLIGQVYSFAIAAGYTDSDPTAALHRALKPQSRKHYATFTDSAGIAMLMRAITAYPYTVMRCALLFSVYTFARPGEVRAAEWSEIKGDVWDIPVGKMKMKRRHIVPLSSQVKSVLEELRPPRAKAAGCSLRLAMTDAVCQTMEYERL